MASGSVAKVGDTAAKAEQRAGLSRSALVRAAVVVADQDGLASVTMRRLGRELGVEAMSLYHHVTNKKDVIDGMVDLIAGEVTLPAAGTPWRSAMRARAVSAHAVLLAHPWATILLASRQRMSPGMARHREENLARLREGGFSVAGALDAWNTPDSHLYGFAVLTEVTRSGRTEDFTFGLELILDGLARTLGRGCGSQPAGGPAPLTGHGARAPTTRS